MQHTHGGGISAAAIIGSAPESREWKPSDFGKRVMVIGGEDSHGWTLHDYVIPRLASGLHVAWEIDLSHPVFKEIEA